VITENIALPHATVESGAKDVAIGFMRLKTPVTSGHRTNDPVKYLFSLSAKNNQAHIELLSELANLLGNPDFLKFIKVVSSREEFKNYIEKAEGENKHE
ncbi:TPA: PTS transporter subunit EIIA, partial [Enterococcus faecalis]|nr:PTS transporter subunit EIIA [Enterococcus faecalis]